MKMPVSVHMTIQSVMTKSKDGVCTAEIYVGIASSTVPMARFKRVLKNSSGFPTKFGFVQALVLPIPPHRCQSCTLLVHTKTSQSIGNEISKVVALPLLLESLTTVVSAAERRQEPCRSPGTMK